MATIEDVIKKTSSYLDKNEQEVVKRAYHFAKYAHSKQKRGTGEPYIQHPLEVANYLANEKMDSQPIAAAFLHDIFEDQPQVIEEMKQQFAPEIIHLVEGVTKLGKIKIKKSWFLPIRILQDKKEEEMLFERHVESLRKMFMAMSQDIRIIIIKLADRLHNMKTLSGVTKEQQLRVAKETLEIYAPLAKRLGMGKIRGELEDYAFPIVYPQEYTDLKHMVGSDYEKKETYIAKIKFTLVSELQKNGLEVLDLHGRKKHLYSLFKKLKRYDSDLSKIYDLVALRIILKTTEDCYKVLGIIHGLWKPLIGRIKDYIALPKPNGYQSLHTTVFGPEGKIFEIQIRTQEMHEQAEHGITAHWHYSAQKSTKKYLSRKAVGMSKDELLWLKELAEWQKKAQDKSEWEKGVKMDFFSDRIFTFTPQGDVFDLPIGATPIDFAYAVHTDVGDSCTGAKVSGKIVPLDYNLKNGDIVDIITGKKAQPKRDWLNFVKTNRAKGKIKAKL